MTAELLKTGRSDYQDKPRLRSLSLQSSQQPRSFVYHEPFLAQCAADAYKTNPAYTAIEKETLNAVAPFLDLQKREDAEHGDGSAKDAFSSPQSTRAYALGNKQDSPFALTTPSTSTTERNRSSSISSMTFEDFRKYAQLVPNDAQVNREGRSLGRLPRRMTTSAVNPYLSPKNGPFTESIPCVLPSKDNSPRVSADLRSGSSSTDIAPSSVQQMNILQERLNSMRLAEERLKSVPPSLSQICRVPDPAFTLTRFIHEIAVDWAPSSLELEEKSRLRKELEIILRAIQPTASLVTFGSVSNGLVLANADMDLMVIDDSEDPLHDLHVDLPPLLYEALKEQGYSVKLIPKARIPLVKVQCDYITSAFCIDICFDNPLALQNTRLVATYAACDQRIPPLILFLKVWARARKVNDAFSGTLKSYGYILMIIYFLQNKTSPSLLPNLQLIAPTDGKRITTDELECCGYDIWFFKNIDQLVSLTQQNTQSLGELMEGFFSHFAYEFDYRDWVISIRLPGGLQTKDGKHWTQMVEHLNDRGDAKVKDRYILSIEDPFEITHNVARTVTRAGLYEMRGEFMHAVRCIRGNKLSELLL